MKINIKKIIIIIIGYLALTAVTCTRDTDEEHHHIFFYNGSDYDVFVDPSYSYPDTSLSQTQNVTTPGWDRKVESHNFNNESLTSRGSYESKLKNKDTLIVFIFNADSLELLGWDYIKSNYVISQRYELSLIDLSQLNWHLSFPPSSEMRNIKMWPPYGTYDANGNRVK